MLSSGVRIFTGSECVKWFMKNMVGVISMQVAQVNLCVDSIMCSIHISLSMNMIIGVYINILLYCVREFTHISGTLFTI